MLREISVRFRGFNGCFKDLWGVQGHFRELKKVQESFMVSQEHFRGSQEVSEGLEVISVVLQKELKPYCMHNLHVKQSLLDMNTQSRFIVDKGNY